MYLGSRAVYLCLMGAVCRAVVVTHCHQKHRGASFSFVANALTRVCVSLAVSLLSCSMVDSLRNVWCKGSLCCLSHPKS